MLQEVRDLVGLDGFVQILLDALSEEDLGRLEKEAGSTAVPGATALGRAKEIARLAFESPTLQSSLTEALDRKNASLVQDLSVLSSEDLLRDYSPQNADLMNAPGCLLWSLFRCKENENCLRLLQIWNDFLVNRSSSDRAGKDSKLGSPESESPAEVSAESQPLPAEPKDKDSTLSASSPAPDWVERMESGQKRLLDILDGLTARIGKIEAELEWVRQKQSARRDEPEMNVPVSASSGGVEEVDEAAAEPALPVLKDSETGKLPREEETPPSLAAPDEVSIRPELSALRAEPVFRQETIVLVGGMDRLVDDYRKMIEGLGGSFERYSSVDEFSLRWLEGLVDRVHLIIVLGNAATRPGTFRLMEIAERLGRRLCVHHSTAPASLYRLLARMVEREEV